MNAVSETPKQLSYLSMLNSTVPGYRELWLRDMMTEAGKQKCWQFQVTFLILPVLHHGQLPPTEFPTYFSVGVWMRRVSE